MSKQFIKRLSLSLFMLPKLLEDMKRCCLCLLNLRKLNPTGPRLPIRLEMFTIITLLGGSFISFLTTTGSAFSPRVLKFWYIVSYSIPRSSAANE